MGIVVNTESEVRNIDSSFENAGIISFPPLAIRGA